jgi:uncharacterized protein
MNNDPPTGAAAVEVAGETLWLLAERAAFRPRTRTLLVADLHLGKPASFRAAALPVPENVTLVDLERLSRILRLTQAARLVVLGDLLHARSGQTAQTVESVAAWREEHPSLELRLVLGNHDRRCGAIPDSWRMAIVGDRLIEEPFVYCHQPDECDEGYVVGGHLHPVAQLAGPGRQRLRVRCFAVGSRRMILPAFGTFTGGAPSAIAFQDDVFAIANDEVVGVGRRR